jgi:hypothetical protein
MAPSLVGATPPSGGGEWGTTEIIKQTEIEDKMFIGSVTGNSPYVFQNILEIRAFF